MVFLTKEEEEMLDGEYGAGTQEAMGILVKLADAYGAERMIPAKSAHVAAGLFLEEVEWYERLIQGGAKFRCFTTRHPWVLITNTLRRWVLYTVTRQKSSRLLSKSSATL